MVPPPISIELDPRVERYVGSILLPSLGHRGVTFSVAPPPVRGTRSALVVIRTERLPPLLMRMHRRRRQARRTLQAQRHLEALGLPAPRPVYHDLGLSSRWFPGRSRPPSFVTVETWIEGTRVSALDEPEARRSGFLAVAHLLARFRGITRPRRGRPGTWTWLSYASRTMLDIRLMIRRARSRGWLTPEEAREVKRAFLSWRPAVAGLAFSLVHKDPNPDNFIMTSSGSVMPVDVHRLSYAPFQEDVVTAVDHFCPVDEEMANFFLDACFDRGGDPSREIFERTRSFFEPFYFLRKLHRLAGHAGEGELAPRVERYREGLLRISPLGFQAS